MLLSQDGFDLWSAEYDESVSDSERNESYPFAGYRDVLGFLYRLIRSSDGTSVLDLGFGTALLSSRLYAEGYKIAGVDFSGAMLALAKEKMPGALLLRSDFTKALPAELTGRRFDFIIGTYSFHHVPPGRRPGFFRGLADLLTARGQILIGDVMFPDAPSYAECKRRFSGVWDNDEIYFTADEFTEQMRAAGLFCTFQPVSFCAGVLILRPIGF